VRDCAPPEPRLLRIRAADWRDHLGRLLELLSQTDPLVLLPRDGRTALAAGGTTWTFCPGEVLQYQGEPCVALHVIVRGLVRIERAHPLMDEPLVLAEAGPGAVVGERAVLDGGLYQDTVVAAEPTEALELPAAVLVAALLRAPAVAETLLPQFSRRLRTLGQFSVAAHE